MTLGAVDSLRSRVSVDVVLARRSLACRCQGERPSARSGNQVGHAVAASAGGARHAVPSAPAAALAVAEDTACRVPTPKAMPNLVV